MAGYMKLYLIGGQGGYLGADGANPIECLLLVGNADRQWFEPHYFDIAIKPIGKLRVVVPAGPDQPDSLLDACIAFCPLYFAECPSIGEVKAALQDKERLDFDACPQDVSIAWAKLREEARTVFTKMNIWQASLTPIEHNKAMDLPKHTELPFFAYGLFKPGQLAFFQLRDLVGKTIDPAYIKGSLLLRDGLPIINTAGHGSVKGALLEFLPHQAPQAYSRISAMEPGKHYGWHEVQVDGISSNVLVGRSPKKGSVSCEDKEWNGWNDPLFTAALDVVKETLESQTFDWDLKPLFKLQMAYLLLWSSIERYVSLRYHLGDKVAEKVRQLAGEPAFSDSLLRHVKEPREVYRADKPDKKVELDPHSPKKALAYYYQVRSNITHRGKGVVQDHERMMKSLEELLLIFRDVLKAAQIDAGYMDE